MRDLSILIPARNEEFIGLTVADIVKNKRGDTEVIVVLDGEWGPNGIEQHPDVKIVYLAESVGQRAATNIAARLSKAKYVMKVDAHCAFDEGFDVKMMEDMQDDWTMVPVMKNLHVFDWVCPNGHRRYQSPSGPCETCGEPTSKEIVWNPKQSPQSTSYRFNKELEFKYFGDYKSKQIGDLVETMSLQGSCFMCTREKYWELDICDENWGSWGGQGAEVALKTWLSGGTVICNKKTWYAHLFRTQGKDFGFPYPNPGNEQKKAKDTLRETFLEDRWPKATRKLEWLVEKFSPVPDWHYPDPENQKKLTKGAVYFTDSELNDTIARQCRKQLRKCISEENIVSVSLRPLALGRNFVVNEPRGYLTMFMQILKGIEESTAEVIYLVEHDVMYHPSHFEFVPPDPEKFYYNTNVWRLRAGDNHLVRTTDARQVSGLVAYRELLLKHYRKRVEMVERNGFTRRMGFEPGTHGRAERVDDYKSEGFESKHPNIDIKHGQNLTKAKWKPEDYRNARYAEGWQEADSVDGWDMKLFDYLRGNK